MDYKGYHVPSREELEAMRNVDVHTVDKASLVDIRSIEIDTTLPPIERTLDFIQKIKNPYCYLDGEMVVKVSFAGKRSIEDALCHYIKTMEG